MAERRLVGVGLAVRAAWLVGCGAWLRLVLAGCGAVLRRSPVRVLLARRLALRRVGSVFRLSGTAGLFVPAGLSAVTAPAVAMSVAVRERPAIVCAHHDSFTIHAACRQP